MSNLNKRIEQFKEEANEKTQQAQAKLALKLKECEHMVKENTDLNLKLKGLTEERDALQSRITKLENPSTQDNDKTREESEDHIVTLKTRLAELRKENETLSLKVNKLDSDVKTVNIDYEIAKQDATCSKEELKVLKERLNLLEAQKKEHLNQLGVSKLGLSSLNFSKFFHVFGIS